jgi:glycerol uptake facilitator-like aquaporin
MLVNPLAKRLSAEFVGTTFLLMIIVGSGALEGEQQRSLDLLALSLAVAFGLAVLISVFGPISGAHFNPVVSLVDWALGRRTGSGLPTKDLGPYVAAQLAGALFGTVLANLMFQSATLVVSQTDRSNPGTFLAEVIATAGLVTVAFVAPRIGLATSPAILIGAYVASAVLFTSSTAFMNPAVTLGRVFTDSLAGIAPMSAWVFVVAQLAGAAVGLAYVLYLYRSAVLRTDQMVESATGS